MRDHKTDAARTFHSPVRQSSPDHGVAGSDLGRRHSAGARFFARASIWIIATTRRSPSWGTGSAIRELKLHSLHSPMYTDDVWGRSGPDAVINITEPVKIKRLQMVDEIKRALEIAETHSVPLPDPASGRDAARSTTSAKSTRRFRRSRRSACSRGSAAWRCCSRTRPTRLSSAERLLMFLRDDAPESERLLRPGPRQHERRRRNGVPAAEEPHPLHARPRQ